METNTNYFGLKEMEKNPLLYEAKQKLSMLLFVDPEMSAEEAANIATKHTELSEAMELIDKFEKEINIKDKEFLKYALREKFHQWVKIYDMPVLLDLQILSVYTQIGIQELIEAFYKGICMFMKKDMLVYLKLCSEIFKKYGQIMTVMQFMRIMCIRLDLDKEMVKKFSTTPFNKKPLMEFIKEKTMQQKNFYGIKVLKNKPLDDVLKQKLSFLLFLHPEYRRETSINNLVNGIKKSDLGKIIYSLEKEINEMGNEYLTSMLSNKIPTWFYMQGLPTYEEIVEVSVYLETDILHWITGFKYYMSTYYGMNEIRRLDILIYEPIFSEETINEILDDYIELPEPKIKRRRVNNEKDKIVKTE